MTDSAIIKKKVWGPKSGLTGGVFSRLYNNKGTRILAIVELESEYTGEGLDGSHDVTLEIKSIEPVTAANVDIESQLDEHIRTIQQALQYERKLAESGPDDQLQFEDGEPRPSTANALQQGKGLVEHHSDTDVTRIYDPAREEIPEPAPA